MPANEVIEIDIKIRVPAELGGDGIERVTRGLNRGFSSLGPGSSPTQGAASQGLEQAPAEGHESGLWTLQDVFHRHLRREVPKSKTTIRKWLDQLPEPTLTGLGGTGFDGYRWKPEQFT